MWVWYIFSVDDDVPVVETAADGLAEIRDREPINGY